MSLNERQKQRMDKNFEPVNSAQERTAAENELRCQGIKRKYDHIGDAKGYTWDKDECLSEVRQYENGHRINFSDLARRYNFKNSSGSMPGNAGQVMKELIKSYVFLYCSFTICLLYTSDAADD